jgi:hypothetical protein
MNRDGTCTHFDVREGKAGPGVQMNVPPRRLVAMLLLLTFSGCWFAAGAAQAQTPLSGPGKTLLQLELSETTIQQILSDIEATTYDTPASWESEHRVQTLRLGNASALVLKGSDLLCGATANCQVWVFRRSDRGWRFLLDRKQPLIADGVSFGPKKTRGLEDLVVTANLSASVVKKYTYKFDGAIYRSAPPTH